MVSPQGFDKDQSNRSYEMWDHDPAGTTALIISPDGGTTDRIFDLRDYAGFTFMAMSSTLTGNGISVMEIVASETSDFSGQTVIIKTQSFTADAVGDWGILECSSAEVKQECLDHSTPVAGRFVAGRLTVANAADEAVAVYIGWDTVHAFDGLTPASTIA